MFASVRSRLVALLTAVLVSLGVVLIPSAAHAAPPTPFPGYAVIYGTTSLPSGASGGGTIELYQTGQTSPMYAFSIGPFEFQYIPAGSYRIEATYSGPSGAYLRTGWAPPGGQPGDDFTVVAGQALEVNTTVQLGGSISGTVSVPAGFSAQGINVNAYDNVGRTVGNAITGADGSYTMTPVPVGRIRLSFVPTNPDIVPEYWNDQATLLAATPVIVVSQHTTAGISPTLASSELTTERLAGADRFATGVEITKKQFTGANPVVPVVYIASGLNYPDALTAGPAAIVKGGALLLVTPDAVPAVVAAELTRLSPQKIIVVGSAASVGNSVKTALEAYVDSPSDVTRLGGADRFATSALVVRDAFPSGAISAFFATGLNFPDALAAGPAAGYVSAPIILVNGGATAPDAATLNLIEDLGIESAYFVGSSTSLSAGVANGISATLSTPGVRFAGVNRYETAVQVNEAVFGSAAHALIATGAGFADALSGGPLAGSLGVPLYLSTPECIPGSVLDGMSDLGVLKAYLLGGTPSLSADVADLVACD